MSKPSSYQLADMCSNCKHYNEYRSRCRLHDFFADQDGWCEDYQWDL